MGGHTHASLQQAYTSYHSPNAPHQQRMCRLTKEADAAPADSPICSSDCIGQKSAMPCNTLAYVWRCRAAGRSHQGDKLFLPAGLNMLAC